MVQDAGGVAGIVPRTGCPRQLPRGHVKRVTAKGPLVGYFIACPGCGFVASYLREEASFCEQSDGDQPVLVGIKTPPPCMRCRKRIHLVAGQLEAR